MNATAVIPYKERRAKLADLDSELRYLITRAEDQNRDLSAVEVREFEAKKAERDAVRKQPFAINAKSDLVDLLHEAGLAKAAAERVAGGGFVALAQDRATTDLASRIDALSLFLMENTDA